MASASWSWQRVGVSGMGIDRRLRIVGVVWLLSGCAGELEDPDRFTFLLDAGPGGTDDDAGAVDAGGGGEVPSCVTEAFEKCGTSACHGAGAPQVDLLSPGVVERLVDQPSLAGGICEDRVYIATDGTESLMLKKLSTTNDCGTPMPFGRSLATPYEDYDCIEAWVISLGGSALEAP